MGLFSSFILSFFDAEDDPVRNTMKSPCIGQSQFAGVPSASQFSETFSTRSGPWVILALTALILLMSAVQAAAWNRPASEQGPTRVIVAVYIADVDEIDSAEQRFTANVYIESRWRDESLVHPGPGTILKDLTDVWHPQIQIINQQRVLKTFPDVVTVFTNGEVIYRQRVWGNFSQALNLQDFPFDRQVFNIRLVAVQHSPEQVELVPSPDIPYGIAEKVSVADWTVVGWNAEVLPYKPVPARGEIASILFSFTAERRIGYFIFKIIIPLVLIVMMSWVVFWIDPKEAGTQISVSITSMLTLIAYRFAVGAFLPKISYMTRLDVFILMSTILVFTSLVEVLLTSTLARGDRLATARRIDLWARMVFPVVFTLLSIYALII